MQTQGEPPFVPVVEVDDEPITEEIEQRPAVVVPESVTKEVFRLPERAKLPITAEQKASQEKTR